MHTQDSAYTRGCMHKAVQTQGGAHTRRSVATTGVLFFKGVRWLAPALSKGSHLLSEASSGAQCVWERLAVHIQGGAYARRCTHEAPHRQGGGCTRQCIHKAVHTRGSARTRQCTHKAVHTQGNAPTRQCIHKAVHTQGGAYTRRCIHKVGHTQGGLWPRQEPCSFRGVRVLAPA